MDYIRSRMEWKEASGEQQLGEFSGHAAVFGNRDLGGDIIEAGAFARTLKARDGKAVLLLGGATVLVLMVLSKFGMNPVNLFAAAQAKYGAKVPKAKPAAGKK